MLGVQKRKNLLELATLKICIGFIASDCQSEVLGESNYQESSNQYLFPHEYNYNIRLAFLYFSNITLFSAWTNKSIKHLFFLNFFTFCFLNFLFQTLFSFIEGYKATPQYNSSKYHYKMKKTQPSDRELILKRYHPNRLAFGTNYIREMDEMIDNLSHNKGQGQSHQGLQEQEDFRRSSKTTKNSHSKYIMKKIINNELWNDLIDMTYNRSFSHQPKSTKNRRQVERSNLIKSQTVFSEKSHRKMIKTAGNSPSSFFKTKIKVGCRNLFEYYNPSKQLCPPIDPVKNHLSVKPSAKMVHEYKARQLKWQNRFLPHYDEQKIEPIDNQILIV